MKSRHTIATIPDHLKGTSFAPLLGEPDRPWKNAGFSQYPNKSRIGRSIQTVRYRYTRWTQTDNPNKLGGLELYDYESDPQENVNIVNQPENAELVKRLTARLVAGRRAALPPNTDMSENEE